MSPRATVLDDYQHVALTSTDWSEVRKHYDVEVLDQHISDPDELVERLRDSEVVVAMRERTAFPAAVLGRLPNLKLLVTTGMMNKSIDLVAARAGRVTVTGTGGKGNSMPEITIGMMIALARNFVPEDRAVRAGGWQHTIGPGLADHTLGLVGLGRLGGRLVPLARAFGMDVIAWSPHLTPERAAQAGDVRAVSKAELFSESDYISVHMALADETVGLIGASDLARMRPSAYLINTSRGPIVDEEALISALTTGRIAGAALDVYDVEPLPVDHRLRKLPNTLLLPHIGYVTTEAYEVFYADAVEDILAFHDGEPIRVL
jgi:phosphoglycerate dehydrogenase-like enzyme